MFKKISIFFLILALIFSGITGYSIWHYNLPLVSPLNLITNTISSHTNPNKVVYGFLPYWNIKYSNELHIQDLTHFAYFAIDLNEDGTINTKLNSKELEPGWYKLSSSSPLKQLFNQVKLLRQKTVLTITAMDPDLIESVINNPDNRQTAINSILKVYQDHHFDGINIDFEHIGYPDDTTRNNFSQFVQNLKNSCLQTNSQCFIDIDVFGDTAHKKRLQNLSSLADFVDHVIIMTYDYYRSSSTQAGPVAPIRGACGEDNPQENCLEQDITTNLAEAIALVPREKIILGIPFYGYEWETATDQFLSNTYPKSGHMVSYQKLMSYFNNPEISSLSAKWSDTTLSPYLTYFEDDKLYQTHFEDPQSLDIKLKLADALNLGGIAIWALGYETPYLDIWQPINSYLNR